jgi:hypothetical protein
MLNRIPLGSERAVAKFEFTKTLEANKLNKRTCSPINEVRTISYGAVIENLEEDGDYLKFTFLGEPYRIREDILRSALRPVGAGDGAAGGPAARSSPAAAGAAVAPGAEAAAEISFRWQDLKSDVRMRRAAVPGGWLVAVTGAGLTYYPDPEHAWDGTSLP